MTSRNLKASLLATTVIAGMVIATPAFAQAATDSQSAPPVNAQTDQNNQNAQTPSASAQGATSPSGGDIVVTGTLIRRENTNTPSPITTLAAPVLQERGVNTVTQALQTLSSNNAGTIPSSWNAGNSNFAGGASGISMRGLDSAYTLVLFDGLRAAVYPYGDDGTRNFVDINSIPDFLIDRIEILRDGASSTYGTDAIAGVVNIITKKHITGLHADVSYGEAQRGYGKEKRLSAVYGIGDYASQGFNVYLGGEYQRNGEILARDTYAPFDSGDASTHVCGTSLGGGQDGFGNPLAAGQPTCVTSLTNNGVNADGSLSGGVWGIAGTRVPFVAPIAMAADGSLLNPGATQLGPFQMLNPAAGCQGLPSLTLTAAQRAQPGLPGNAPANGIICQEDQIKEYLQFEPRQTRYGLTGRASLRFTDAIEGYVTGSWYRNQTYAISNPYNTSDSGFRTATGGTRVDLRNLVLPAYVCPIGTIVACTAANGTLNPNDPFAAQGLGARLLWSAPVPHETWSTADSFRAAAGLNGDLGNAWHWNLDAVGMRITANTTDKGSYNIRHVLNAVQSGSFNFVDLGANSQAQWDYLFPVDSTSSYSKMAQLQGSISGSLLHLPGGDLGVAAGAAIRHESLDWRSSNPVNTIDPADSYDGYINRVGAKGARTVKSVYGELDAPILDMLEVDAAGRYDSYSSGQKAFSPKFGFKFKPVQQLTLRGTWSRGFRVPSFNEAYGLPTTGYIPGKAGTEGGAAYAAAHGNDAYVTVPYSYGVTSVANPSLKPEKSRNITLGAIIQPIHPLTFTVDFYDIKIKDLIGLQDTSSVVGAYYANNGVVNIPGIVVTPDAVDPAFPNALARIDNITASYINVGSYQTRGLDFSAEAHIRLGGIRWTSFADASRILKLRQSNQPYDYEGTLSPCNVTSCSGAPKWRGSWQNTFNLGQLTLSETAYYTGGYDDASVDVGGIPGDCLASIGASVFTYGDGVTPVVCKQKSFITVDATATYKVNHAITLYANVLNVFNRKAPYDPAAAYGLVGYNPAFHEAGIVGRYFRAGARFDFDPPRHIPVAEPVAPPPPPPPAAPATQTCADGTVILATDACPAPPPPPPPPAPAPERGQ